MDTFVRFKDDKITVTKQTVGAPVDLAAFKMCTKGQFN